MSYFAAYAPIDTRDLFDPSSYFNSAVQDIGTTGEFRSHISTESLDVAGVGMNDANTAIVESVSVFVGSGIAGPGSEQSLSWQATGMSRAYTGLFDTTFDPPAFGAALLSGRDVLQGSSGQDFLFAFRGNDQVDGGGASDLIDGGPGRDTLTGGRGSDEFYFDSAIKDKNADHITDFRPGHDKVWLAAGVYTALPPGDVDPSHFVVGTHPNDADDYLIYNPANGILSYDADGSGSSAAMVTIAILDHHPTIAASDLFIAIL